MEIGPLFKSHPKDGRSLGLNLKPPDYKVNGITTTLKKASQIWFVFVDSGWKICSLVIWSLLK